MTTLVLQSVVTVLSLVFAVLAWRIARARTGVPDEHRAAWILVAVAFMWRVGTTFPQNLAAIRAYLSGPGSSFYETYLHWAPVINHGRALPASALGFGLVLLPRLRTCTPTRIWRWSTLVVLVLFLGGAYMGWREGRTSAFHLSALAVFNSVEMVGLLAGLLVGLFTSSLDRHLWLLLAVYALHLAFNIVWLSALTGFFVPNEWYPSPKAMQIYALAAYAAMIALVVRRLLHARRGIPVPALLEPLEVRRTSVFG